MHQKRLYIFIAIIFAGLAVQAVFPLTVFAGTYLSSGAVVSTNLLAGNSAKSIDNFYYNLSSLPGNSSVTVQFSTDNSSWYSAAGGLGGSTTLTTLGGANISLASLNWSGSAFYYKLTLNATSDLSATPVIASIRLDYTPSGNAQNVFTIGTNGTVTIGSGVANSTLSVSGGGLFGYSYSALSAPTNGLIVQGYAGIGTSSPQGLLDVSGSSSGTTLTSFDGTRALSIVNTNTTNNNASGFDFRTMDLNGLITTGAKIMGVYTSHTANLVSGDLAFLTRSAGTMAEGMRLTSTGTFGIGTTSPYAKLAITGSAGGAVPLFAISSSTVSYATTTVFQIDPNGLLTLNTPGATSTITGNLYVNGTLRSTNSYVGDLIFGNGFRFTEADSTTIPQSLFLQNQMGDSILNIDDKGNLNIRGDVCSNSITCFGQTLNTLSSDMSALASTTALSQALTLSGFNTKINTLTLAIASTTLDLQNRLSLLESNLQTLSSITATITTTTAQTLIGSPSFLGQIAETVKNLVQSGGDWIISKITATVAIFQSVQSHTVTTDELCADGVCLNKEQLKALLTQAGGTSSTTPVVASTTAQSNNQTVPILIVPTIPVPIEVPTVATTSATTTTSTSTTSTSTTTTPTASLPTLPVVEASSTLPEVKSTPTLVPTPEHAPTTEVNPVPTPASTDTKQTPPVSIPEQTPPEQSN